MTASQGSPSSWQRTKSRLGSLFGGSSSGQSITLLRRLNSPAVLYLNSAHFCKTLAANLLIICLAQLR